MNAGGSPGGVSPSTRGRGMKRAPVAPGPRPVVDPRIRRRQVEVLRAAGRRRLRLVVVLLAVVAVGAVGWGTSRSSLLDVDRVTVRGAVHTDPRAVRAAAAIRRGRPMIDADVAGAARRVRSLPWVLRADVRREWPATVAIRVVERTATAVTRDAMGGWALVDASGQVLAHSGAPPPAMAAIEGVPAAGEPGTRLAPAGREPLAVASALPPGLAPRVAAVGLGAGGVQLRLRPQGTVLLGPAENVDAKLRAALTVLAAVDGRTVGTVDVRIPSTPVLTRP